MPNAVLEAMACALPVVAPDITRLRAIVRHEGEGLLYDPRDPAALADALTRLTDRAYRARLGAAARRRVVERYSWAVHCRTLERAVRDTLDRRREIGQESERACAS